MRISVEANIGAGKTTLINRLKEAMPNVPVFLEPIEEWTEWLELFYKDPDRWGFTFNLNALMSFMRVPAASGLDTSGFDAVGDISAVITERSPLSCYQVFTSLQRKHNNMSAAEFELFSKIYAKVAWTPDVIVYIRTDPVVCQDRMIRRDRSSERGVGLDYLRAVHDQHEALIVRAAAVPTNKKMRIITVDGNRDADSVFVEVLEKLTEVINATNASSR